MGIEDRDPDLAARLNRLQVDLPPERLTRMIRAVEAQLGAAPAAILPGYAYPAFAAALACALALGVWTGDMLGGVASGGGLATLLTLAAGGGLS